MNEMILFIPKMPKSPSLVIKVIDYLILLPHYDTHHRFKLLGLAEWRHGDSCDLLVNEYQDPKYLNNIYILKVFSYQNCQI